MRARNLEKQHAAQAAWYQNTVKPRRAKWLAENGPCRKCGSTENLEVDHVDRTTKVHHAVWTWAYERRMAELAKCQVLCEKCHLEKTMAENLASKTSVVGINARKTVCKRGHPFDLFNTVLRSDGGRECRACNNSRRARQRERRAA